MRITLSNEQYQQVKDLLAYLETSQNPLLEMEAIGLWSRGDVSAASGISGSTLAAIARGKRPSKSQMAALKFAMLTRVMNVS